MICSVVVSILLSWSGLNKLSAEKLEFLHRNKVEMQDLAIKELNYYEYSRCQQANATGVKLTQLYVDDIFIGLKTTKRFHSSRVDLLRQTWIPQAMKSVCIKINV